MSEGLVLVPELSADAGLRLLQPTFAPTGPEHFAVHRDARLMFELSDDAADVLSARGGPRPAREAIEADITRLRQYGFWPRRQLHRPASMQTTVTVGVHLAHACNLSCTYCNVGSGAYGEAASLMTVEVARAALELLEHLSRRHGPAIAMLVLFGGEPTLNWPVLVEVVRCFRERFPDAPHDVWLVTNGTLLDSKRAAFLARYRVLTVLSLDGGRESHDACRRFVDGRGSFDVVREGLACLRDSGARYTVRGTWSAGNDRQRQLAELRTLAPDAHQVTVAVDYHAGSGEYRTYADSVQAEWVAFERSGYTGPAPATAAVLIDAVLRGEWAPAMTCPAAERGFAVTPDGSIHACQVCAAHHMPPLGNVCTGGLDAPAQETVRRMLHTDDPGPACAQCPVRPLCGGPCLLVRPLPERHHSCDILAMELQFAARFAMHNPLARLAERYVHGLQTPSQVGAMQRGAALRGIVRERNRHVRPLALCPVPAARALHATVAA